MSLTIPLIQHRRDVHAVNNNRHTHRRYRRKKNISLLNGSTSNREISWMTWYIILLYIVATASTKLNNSVVGFQPLTTTHPFYYHSLTPNFGIPARMTDYTQQQQQHMTTSTKSIQPMIHQQQQFRDPSLCCGRRSKTQLYFMGSDSGILGVGGPEVFLIVLVGYFVLGPSDLYKLVKQIGAFIQNIRTLGSDLSTTFENNMESTLQLEEIRKAQRELNDAFSFRRTINVDADSDAFSVQAGSAQKAEAERLAAAAATATTAATTTATSNSTSVQPQRPKKIRRRIRKREEPTTIPDVPSMSEYNQESSSDFITNNIPDLEMPMSGGVGTTSEQPRLSDEEVAIIEEEFDQYVLNPMTSTFDDWDSWDGTNRMDDEVELQSTNGTATTRNTTSLTTATTTIDPVTKLVEQNRFQQQLSGNWNDQILKAGDKLEPIALVMNKIALLEQEKNAALQRLDEEYAQRTAIEEKYYREQRQLLEATARKVQSNAFGLDSEKTIV